MNANTKVAEPAQASQSCRTPNGTASFFQNEELDYKTQLKTLDTELDGALQDKGVDISYKSSATPIRTVFELPIPVDSSGAHVTYRFATDEFDISFGIFFQGSDGKMETVLPSTRVESHQEPVSGDITVHRPGLVILLFDNSYSWLTTKTLSYSVNLKYPSTFATDRQRTQRVRKVLETAYRDISVAEEKEKKIEDTYSRLSEEVERLERQLAAVQAELEEKRNEMQTLADDKAMVERTLEGRRAHVLPLLWRALSVPALLNIAAFTTPKDPLHMVNKLHAKVYSSAQQQSDVNGDVGYDQQS